MCGAVVPGDRRSWLIAIAGRFTVPRPTYPGDPRAGGEWCHSVITLVVDAETGAPTDGGGGDEYPDLAAAGPVITDYEHDER
jgi:hypothetical protein